MVGIIFKDREGSLIHGSLTIPAGTGLMVIMSHGFGSNKESSTYLELEKILKRKGIGTLRYTHCAGGAGPDVVTGKYSMARDVTTTKAVQNLEAAVAHSRNHGITRIVLLGASFGGLISHIYAAQDPGISGLVLKSSICNPVEFWKERAGQDGIRRWEEDGHYRYTDDLEDYVLDLDFWKDLRQYNDIEDRLRKIECPALIIHGGRDKIVPPHHARELARLISDSDLRILANADHLYSGEGEKEYMLESIAGFLTEKIYASA